MKFPIKDIIISDRIREDYGDVEALKRSIKRTGQLQNLVIGPNNELIIGGRRYRALKELGFTEVEVTKKDSVSEVDKLTMEIEENLPRKDFSDAEKIRGLLMLHRAKQREFGPSQPGRAVGWTLQDTAELLSYSKGAISVMLKVAEAQEAQEALIPEEQNKAFMEALAKGSVYDAYKELATSEAEQVLAKVAEFQKKEEVKEKSEAVVFVDRCLSNANCKDYVQLIPDGTIQLVLTDPPYGVNYQDLADYKGDDSPEYATKLMAELAPELYRICDKNAVCMVFFGIRNMPALIDAMEKVGFKSAPTPFIWVKDVDHGGNNQPNRWLTSAFEFAWMFIKGDPILTTPGALGYFITKPPAQEIKRHPTQKPAALIHYLIKTLSHPGQNLFEPFAGSGVILQVGIEAGLNVCGCELNPEYYHKARAMMIEQKSGMSVVNATLMQLGFSTEAIALATEETKNTIIQNNYTNQQATILEDGSLFILSNFGA